MMNRVVDIRFLSLASRVSTYRDYYKMGDDLLTICSRMVSALKCSGDCWRGRWCQCGMRGRHSYKYDKRPHIWPADGSVDQTSDVGVIQKKSQKPCSS